MDPTGDPSAPAASPPNLLCAAATAPEPRVAGPAALDSAVAKGTAQGNELPCPELRRPDLVGAFDASAHSAADFDFSAASVLFGRAPAKKTFKIRAKRVRNRHSRRDPVREASALITGLTNQTQLEAFAVASRMVPIHTSPRKRAMLESPKAGDDTVAEFDEFPEDLELDLWDAKASLRDHLLGASPVHTAATKRRVNGHERNWIRAHKADPDVQYLLQFPGDMPAEKARDLVYRRDMLALSVVEEDADGSMVMEMFIPSAAEHISEAARQEKLDKAAVAPRLVADRVEEEEDRDSGMSNSETMETQAQVTQAEPVEEVQVTTISSEPVQDIQPVSDPVTDDVEVIQATNEPAEETQTIQAGFEPIEEIQVTPIGPEPVTNTIQITQASREQTPQTPSRDTQNDIVDVDLHTQSDIFASVMPKRHQEMNPSVPAQPAWAAAATPRPQSSPVGVLDVDEDVSANWSPLAATPGVQTAVTTTPRPQSSPTGTFEVDQDGSAHWSPLAHTPGSIQQTTASTPRPRSSPVGAFEIDQDMSAHWSPIAPTPGSTHRTDDIPETPAEIMEPNTPNRPAETPSGESTQQGQQFLVRFRGSMGPEEVSENAAPDTEDDVQFTFEVNEVHTPARDVAESTEQQVAVSTKKQETPVQNEDRNYLLRFMIKHQAGKSKGAVSPAPTAAPRTPDQANTQHTSVIASTPVQHPVTTASTPIQPANVSAQKPKHHAGTPVRAISRVTDQVETPVRTSISRSRPGRTPLGQLDTNSPSPVKARTGKRKMDDGPGDEELPEGKAADGEDEKAAEPSPKRRRGLRDRKPAAPPTPLPANARAVRNGEKDLASLTRANTRANKGNAAWPEEVLERFAADPMGQKWKERKEVVDAKAARAAAARTKADGKNVRWAETLAQYRESTPVPEDEEEDEIAGAPADDKDDVFSSKAEGESKNNQSKSETKPDVEMKDEPKETPKPKPRRGRPRAAATAATATTTAAATSVTAPATPVPAKTAPKSKLPAPVSRTRGAKAATTTTTPAVKAPVRAAAKTAGTIKAPAVKAPAKIPKVEDDKVVKRRSTRAAAQQSNVSMGLTETGTPIRRGRGRPRAT